MAASGPDPAPGDGSALKSRCRGRFAPTPSGPLHLGSIVAALGSYLEARTRFGEWRVRIDDLDPPRVVPGAADDILRSLDRLGFEWDGPVIYQSQRTPAYHAALHRLRERGLVYPCACSRKEFAEHAQIGVEGPIYPGSCRDGMPAGREARALRLRTGGARIAFDDGVLGPLSRDIEHEAGDFVLYRADGVFSFHLASAVDDGELGITEVVRGADLLESSARQLHVIRLLGLPEPRYAHLPVVVNEHGEKLSKQTHAAPVDLGKPGAVLYAALRFLGQAPPASLQQAAPPDIWSWARTHWRLEHIPRRGFGG